MLKEALQMAEADAETRKQIVKRALEEGYEAPELSKRQWKDRDICVEGRMAQRKAQTDAFSG